MLAALPGLKDGALDAAVVGVDAGGGAWPRDLVRVDTRRTGAEARVRPPPAARR